MQRRQFLTVSAASGLTAKASKSSSNQYIEVQLFHMRYSRAFQPKRLATFLEEHHLPMAQRNDFGPVGYFNVTMGADQPMLVMTLVYDSLADMEAKSMRRLSDKRWMSATDKLGSDIEPAFMRMESSLLRAFDKMPTLVTPKPPAATQPERIFDLRIYQAETFRDVREKVRMFNTGEIDLFRKVGVNPVFFGQAVVGPRLPNLTYLVWYDDMAARQKAWETFLNSAEWKKMISKPEWANYEIVSNISNIQMTPLPFSNIR